MKSFFDEIAAIIDQLPDAIAFRESERGEDSRSFGNSYAVYESSLIKVRFVKDRDEIRTEIAAPQMVKWLSLDQICEVLGRPVTGLDLQSNGEALVRNYSEILKAITDTAIARTSEAIDVQARKKRDGMLARLGKCKNDPHGPTIA